MRACLYGAKVVELGSEWHLELDKTVSITRTAYIVSDVEKDIGEFRDRIDR